MPYKLAYELGFRPNPVQHINYYIVRGTDEEGYDVNYVIVGKENAINFYESLTGYCDYALFKGKIADDGLIVSDGDAIMERSIWDEDEEEN